MNSAAPAMTAILNAFVAVMGRGDGVNFPGYDHWEFTVLLPASLPVVRMT